MEDGLFDIPDFDGMEDEAFPPLPPPHSPGQGGREDGDPFGEEDGDVSKLAEVPAATRKGVKRPQPKLDSQRLISERGLPALRTLFDNVRFKGKGHEAEDLRLLMQKMENWAHRLYPKLQFEDFIDKVEKLGSKKEVQTCLKRIRLDMPLTHEDFMGGEEEAAAPESHVFGDPDPFNEASFNDLQAPVHSTPAPAAPAAPSPASPFLTEEQRKRMELNRQRALEKRLARQQQQTDPSDSQTADSPTSADGPTSVSSANILNNSKDQDEEMEDLDLEPASSTQEPPSQLPHTDSEPSAESPRCEKEEGASLNQVHQPSNEEKTSLSQVHQPSNEEKTSLSQVHQPSNEEKNSLSQVHQPSNEEKTSLSQVHQPSNEEKNSLSQVHQPSNEEKNSLSQVHQPSNEEKTSLSQVHQPSNEEKNSLSQVHQPSNKEKTSLSQVHQPSYEEKNSLSQVHQPSNEEKNSLSQVHQPSNEEKNSLSQVHQPSNKEKTSLSQVHQPSNECQDGD